MSRFNAFLHRTEERLALPKATRSLILVEVAADLDDLFQYYLQQGLSEEEAAARAEEKVDMSDEALAELVRIHSDARGWTDRMVRVGQPLGERVAMDLIVLFFLASAAMTIGLSTRVLTYLNGFIWPIAGIFLALMVSFLFQLTRNLEGMSPRRLRQSLVTPLFLGGAAIAGLAIVTQAACAVQHAPASPPFWVEPVTGMEFVYVAPARFRMGSGPGVVGRQDDETPHDVLLTKGFYLGRYEVTQGQWFEIMGDNPSQFPECGPNCPVETVSYFDIHQFIKRLEDRSEDNRFRLPTEAEWELACRAGTDSPFSTGATITSEEANFDGLYPYNGAPRGTFRESPAPVGSYPPNPWGFFDLHGNVWEWCEDWYGAYPEGEVRDPTGPPTGTLRVIRGGSWYFDANSTRSALRYTHAPQDSGFSLGIRLVRELSPQ